MNHLSGNVSFLFSSGYFHIFSDASADFSVLPRILFCIFPSAYEKSAAFFHPDHPFSEIFSLRRNNFSCLFPSETEKFSISSPYFYASPEFFQKKNPLFGVSITQFRTCFSWQSGYFSSFFVGNWEIFLPVSIFFALLLNFFKRKIRFFQHEFPLRMIHFSLPRGVFPDFFVSSDKEFHPSRGIFRSIRQEFSPFRIFFARTRCARTCTRVIIYWVPLPAPFPLFRKTCRKTYLKHSILWIFLQKKWKKVWVKVGESEKVRNFAPAFERERRWRDDNLKGNGAGSSGSAAVQVSYLNGVKGARTAAGRSQLPPLKKLFEKKLSKKFGGFEKSS